MMRPVRSLNWYEPGLSGIEEGTGRCTPPLSRSVCAIPMECPEPCRALCSSCRPGNTGNNSVPWPTTPRWATRLSPPATSGTPHPSGALNMLRLQAPLPDRYTLASPAELDAWIADAKASLGERVLILGHHYQRDEVIRWADMRGDSFKLARFAADNHAATDIVFCGVHFMAESADVLTGDHQRVILPDLNAGCSMADMADVDQVEECWELLAGVTGIERVVPITYMNSSAALKAFVGQHGGAVCTSSNARAVLEWVFERGDGTKVLFFPDQHL